MSDENSPNNQKSLATGSYEETHRWQLLNSAKASTEAKFEFLNSMLKAMYAARGGLTKDDRNIGSVESPLCKDQRDTENYCTIEVRLSHTNLFHSGESTRSM